MTNINPIRFGITGNNYFKHEEKEDLAKNNKEAKSEEKSQKQYESNELLGFLAAQNADIRPAQPTRTYNVSKYVNAEQESRIADFMKGFEADFEGASKFAKDEFPDINQRTADNIALAYINATY